jgi:hypothetical protein
VCLDELGRTVGESAVAWSAAGLQRLVERLRALAAEGCEVTLAVEAEDATEEVARVLCGCGLPVKAVAGWMVEALWRAHKRRRQTVVVRAHCLAQVLLVSDCPPVGLGAPAGVAHAAEAA